MPINITITASESMQTTYLPLSDTNQYPKLLLDFVAKKPSVLNLINNYPDKEGFSKQLELKKESFSQDTRQSLVSVLTAQYANLTDLLPEVKASISASIASLSQPNTFTITTGHQLNIASGPAYLFYKLISTITLCRQLKDWFPENNFVPVYWLASEDHDLAEINHFTLFGKDYSWDTGQSGAVGRMSTDGLLALMATCPDGMEVFAAAYAESKTLAEATIKWVSHYFGQYGLICLEPDNNVLKTIFGKVMQAEVANVGQTESLVHSATAAMETAGYKGQIMPRPINLFYLSGNTAAGNLQNAAQRERIVATEDGTFKVLNTEITFANLETLQAAITQNPASFSPNVGLRPLYQETVLPNLAYIGGPAEVAYWCQLKGVFAHHNVPFPIVMPRLMATVFAGNTASKLEKLQIPFPDLFKDESTLKKQFIALQSTEEVSLNSEAETVKNTFALIESKASSIDKTLKDFVLAEAQKVAKAIDNIEKRIKKAEESKHEVQLRQLTQLRDKVLPGGHMQERSESFITFLQNNPDLLSTLIDQTKALQFQLAVVTT